MKKILTLSCVLALGISAFAQQNKRVCGTDLHEQFLEQKDPNRKQKREDYAKTMQKYMAMQKNSAQKSQTIIQIPLVVHMVYASTTDSITDAQIFSQIQVLNEDYTRTNADASTTPAPFAAVASSPQVNYCWAQRDPSGNPTTGIERRKSTTTSWTTDDKVKSFATGGLDAWDPSRYFNIWVCNLGGGLLGYGEFPTGSLSNTYGFVAGYFCFGNMGKVNPPYDKGRTATHEIGHCFNLLHIWGDDGGACTGTDQCADTPNQAAENYGCPAYPHTDACAGSAPGVMFMNYMDYTDDGCMNTFTANQSTRMTAVVNNPPYNSLSTSNGCQPLTLPPIDAGITTITKPVGGLGCTPTFVPNVTIKNWGTNTLTSCTIQYKIDNLAVQNYSWSGSLASLATATVNLASMTATAGTHTFSANTSSPNGGADGNAANDLATSNFNVSASVGASVPWTEGFESAATLPAGWNLYNPDADAAWQINTTVAKTGVHSMGFNNCDGDGATDMTGRIDKVMTTGFDLSSVSSATLTMDVAYAVLTYSGTPYPDKLEVKVSTNCGTTWTSVYSKTGATLASAPTYTSIAACWVPTGASQWRNDVINLTPYVGQSNVMISFENTSDWGTWVYLDNLNIAGTVGIKTESAIALGVSIYPNPSADGKFKVDVKKGDISKLSVYDLLGNKVYEMNQKMIGSFDIDLSNLSNGTYLVEVTKDGKPAFNKVVINK